MAAVGRMYRGLYHLSELTTASLDDSFQILESLFGLSYHAVIDLVSVLFERKSERVHACEHTNLPEAGSNPMAPEQKRRSPSLIAWE